MRNGKLDYVTIYIHKATPLKQRQNYTISKSICIFKRLAAEQKTIQVHT
jgi:hypothetical protein